MQPEDKEGVSLMQSLQDRYAPHHECFGCGATNHKGLQIKSMVEGDKIIAHWRAQPHHIAFKGMLNGGICGALLDCHSKWTAAYFLMKHHKRDTPSCTVTAEYKVTLHHPTPTDNTITLVAWVEALTARKAVVASYLEVDQKKTVSCLGTFVAVREGHPAYQRW